MGNLVFNPCGEVVIFSNASSIISVVYFLNNNSFGNGFNVSNTDTRGKIFIS